MGNALKYRRSKMNVSISGDTDLLICVEDDGEAFLKRISRLSSILSSADREDQSAMQASVLALPASRPWWKRWG